MRRILSGILLLALSVPAGLQCLSQTDWYYRRGLLPEKTLDLLINESSGETAWHTISDLSDPVRKRTADEFADLLYESQYITTKLKEYGLSDVKVEKLEKIKVWHPVKGDLWEISPGLNKIADFSDIPFVLHPNSMPGDREGELVDIKDATSSVIDRLDLAGKIVITSARPEALMNIFLQKEVAGVISDYNYHIGADPVSITDRKIENLEREFKTKMFVFKIPKRDADILRKRLQNNEKIILKGSVRYRTEDMENQVPTCIIPGTDPNAGEIIFSAHLFEGYGVQGANDNISGSAVILETARLLNKLITEGKINRPRRTIRFIWIAEYSGSILWEKAHPDIIRKTLCNINLDMVGLSLSKYKSCFVLHRTSYGNAHYVNDVVENYYRYVSENNQANSVVSGDRFFKPIVAPTGTDDPFVYQIESSSGGSDHDVFNDFGTGVPGVLLITWPDPFYHTSEDRADNMDPTQLKRVAFITAAASYTIAEAGENEAIALAGEVYGNSVKRLGYEISVANDLVNKSGADNLLKVLNGSVSRIKGTSTGEAMTLNSVTELAPANQFLKDMVANMAKSLTDMTTSASASLLKTAEHMATDFGMKPLVIEQSKDEKDASAMVPVLKVEKKGAGYGILDTKYRGLPEDVNKKFEVKAYVDYEEVAKCVNGKNSILDIKNILDAQRQDVTDIKDLMNVFRRLESAGIVKL